MLNRVRQRREAYTFGAASDVAGDIHAQRRTEASSASASDVAVDRAAARLATHQHGVVGRAQLLALGVSEHAIDHRVRTGRFLALYRGVYALGHAALSDLGKLHAARELERACAEASLRNLLTAGELEAGRATLPYPGRRATRLANVNCAGEGAGCEVPWR